MKVIIEEIGKLADLSIYNENGVDWACDLIGNATYDLKRDEDGNPILSEADYEWWEDYISDAAADNDELVELRNTYDRDEVDEILRQEWENDGNDYDRHHLLNQTAFERIRAELTPIN